MKKAWIELDDKLFECKGFEDMIVNVTLRQIEMS